MQSILHVPCPSSLVRSASFKPCLHGSLSPFCQPQWHQTSPLIIHTLYNTICIPLLPIRLPWKKGVPDLFDLGRTGSLQSIANSSHYHPKEAMRREFANGLNLRFGLSACPLVGREFNHNLLTRFQHFGAIVLSKMSLHTHTHRIACMNTRETYGYIDYHTY
jgi:hypothetical protein